MITSDIKLEELEEIFNEYKENYVPINNEFIHNFVYIKNNQIIGFIIYSLMYENIEIIDFFVKKEYRRKKIGKKLLEEVLKNEYKNITLEVNENNIPAINLYNKLGFKKVAVRKNYYKDGNALLMLKEVGD